MKLFMDNIDKAQRPSSSCNFQDPVLEYKNIPANIFALIPGANLIQPRLFVGVYDQFT